MAESLARRDRPAASRATRATKPAELEDWLNARIYHRLSERLAVALVPTGVSPHLVSVAGGLLIVAAGIFYTSLPWPLSVALGFTAHAAWHVVDGADGDLARLTGRASAIGELIDGACDYIGHALLYVLLAALLAEQIGGWAWWIVLASGLCRIAQSNHSESRRRTYLWRVYGIPWLKQAETSRDETLERPGLLTRALAAVGKAYVAAAADPLAERVDRLVADDAARRICKRASRQALRVHNALGANFRTVALGLSMAAGSPLWFFLYELVGMNALLLWSKALQRRCDRALAARLGG